MRVLKKERKCFKLITVIKLFDIKKLTYCTLKSWHKQFCMHFEVSGNKWSCPALFIKLLVFLLLIKDCNSLTLTGRLSVLALSCLPSYIERSAERTSFIWSCIFTLTAWVFLPLIWQLASFVSDRHSGLSQITLLLWLLLSESLVYRGKF